jgi:hypothetical protein
MFGCVRPRASGLEGGYWFSPGVLPPERAALFGAAQRRAATASARVGFRQTLAQAAGGSEPQSHAGREWHRFSRADVTRHVWGRGPHREVAETDELHRLAPYQCSADVPDNLVYEYAAILSRQPELALHGGRNALAGQGRGDWMRRPLSHDPTRPKSISSRNRHRSFTAADLPVTIRAPARSPCPRQLGSTPTQLPCERHSRVAGEGSHQSSRHRWRPPHGIPWGLRRSPGG